MKTFHASILYCCGFCVSSCVKYTTQNNTYPMPPTDHGGAWTQVYENPAETLHQPGYRKRAGGDGDAGQAHQSESDIHPGGLNGKRSVALRRTRFQRRLCRLCAGSSNRGASVLLAHDFQFESVVCYTFEGACTAVCEIADCWRVAKVLRLRCNFDRRQSGDRLVRSAAAFLHAIQRDITHPRLVPALSCGTTAFCLACVWVPEQDRISKRSGSTHPHLPRFASFAEFVQTPS